MKKLYIDLADLAVLIQAQQGMQQAVLKNDITGQVVGLTQKDRVVQWERDPFMAWYGRVQLAITTQYNQLIGLPGAGALHF